jgi:hypothetical protein
MTPEDDHLLESRIVDGLSREKGNAQESYSDEPEGGRRENHERSQTRSEGRKQGIPLHRDLSCAENRW